MAVATKIKTTALIPLTMNKVIEHWHHGRITDAQWQAFAHFWETAAAARFADHGHRNHPTDPKVLAELAELMAATGLGCCKR